MRLFSVIMLLLAASIASAQVSITSTSPAANATNVPTTTIVSVTFSGPIDTTQRFRSGDNFFTNVTSAVGQWWSADRQTVNFAVLLQPSTVYFLLIHGVTPAAGGGLTTPYVFYFTTGASFPANLHSINGTISSGGSPVTPDNAIVGLGATPFTGSDPAFVGAAVTNALGQFTIPYVPDGTWYPVAAKDADHNGQIDPANGDPIAFGDSVLVSGADVYGFVMYFQTFQPVRFAAARDTIPKVAATGLPPNRQLRQFYAWQIDSTGAAKEWVALYTVPGSPVTTEIAMEPIGFKWDTSSTRNPWAFHLRPYTGLATAALMDSVVARAERMGGREYRRQAPPVPGSFFNAYARLGALHYTEFSYLISDTSKDYWGLQYTFQVQVRQDSSYGVSWKIFLADATTGEILNVVGVDDKDNAPVPTAYALEQNYPNPFNPSTTISFSVPTQSRVKIQVFNLLGQQVATLVDDVRIAGTHHAVWNASVPSGIYFYRMEATSTDAPAQHMSQVRKMMLVR